MTTTELTTEPPRADARVSTRRSGARPFRTELLRGFAPWAGAALVAGHAWALASMAPSWQGDWAQTTSTVGLIGVLLGGPLALGAGCWQGGRERRRGTVELRAASARSPLAQFGTAALPLALWLAAGYALTVAAVFLATWPYAYRGGLPSTLPLGTAGVIVACSLLGHVLGATAPWRLTAPVLALAAYGVFGVLLNDVSSDMVHALGPRPSFAPSRELIAWWSPPLTAVWFLALAATAVLAFTARRRWTVLVPLTVAVAMACTLVQTVDAATRPDPRRKHQVCTSSRVPQICVNATRAGLLPEVTEALTPLTGRLKGVRNLPTRFEDLPSRPRANEAELPDLLLGQEVVRGVLTDKEWFARNAMQTLLAYDCPDSVPTTAADEAVILWLAPSRLQDSMRARFLSVARKQHDARAVARLKAEDAAHDRLAALSPGERRDWLSRYFATARDCGRTLEQVPAL
ncbi:hypothetical protein [Streptomyces sp. BH105]|uniref:hypothetical protein n=1 Tax=Streptomyces sp. BH105 TaxID=3410408 RepID=UPI003CE74387